MPRLIDTDVLLKVPNVRKVCEYDETGECITYKAVPVEAIEKAEGIDIVQCKDCKHYHTENEILLPHCTISECVCYKNDFCSHGERKITCE